MPVLESYLTGHGATIRSSGQAIRAGVLVGEYLAKEKIDDLPVAGWTPARQLDFAKFLRADHEHSASTIERVFNVVSAAFKDAARVQMRTDPLTGEKIEGALMTYAPDMTYKKARLVKELRLPPPRVGVFVPTLEEMGRFIDALETPHLRRWIILALNTWARPEAITDLDPAVQFDARTGFLDLNPPGRPQTNKRRPVILATQGLAGWFPIWNAENAAARARQAARDAKDRVEGKIAPDLLLLWKRERVGTVKLAIKRIADEIGLPEITQKSPRTFMSTMARKMCSRLPREKRSIWMGHAVKEGSRTTDNYEMLDAEYLADVATATDFVISQLQCHCNMRLFSVEPLLKVDDLRRIGATKSKKSVINKEDVGGRDRD